MVLLSPTLSSMFMMLLVVRDRREEVEDAVVSLVVRDRREVGHGLAVVALLRPNTRGRSCCRECLMQLAKLLP